MFPPVPAADDRRRLPGLRRPLEPDPRRVRRGGRAVRARGAPERDRLRLLDDACATLEAIGHRPAFGLNWDPSPLVWQDLDPVGFILDFARPDLPRRLQGRQAAARRRPQRPARLAPAVGRPAPRLGLRVHRPRRRAVGGLLPGANAIGYAGPISVEWEDAGMDRLLGAPEALEFVKRLAFDPPAAASTPPSPRARWFRGSGLAVPHDLNTDRWLRCEERQRRRLETDSVDHRQVHDGVLEHDRPRRTAAHPGERVADRAWRARTATCPRARQRRRGSSILRGSPADRGSSLSGSTLLCTSFASAGWSRRARP